jgi:hypothetical protein
MRKPLIPVLLLVLLSVVLGATVFRADVAQAATSIFVNNDPDHPVPVHEQGTATVSVANTPLAVNAGFETQVLLDQVFSGGDRATIPVAAYKTIHVDFVLLNGNCFGSGSSLLIVEATHFIRRGFIGADDACTGGFSGIALDTPGRSLTFIVNAQAGDTWRVLVFGRAN